jgi:hypothetical protein
LCALKIIRQQLKVFFSNIGKIIRSREADKSEKLLELEQIVAGMLPVDLSLPSGKTPFVWLSKTDNISI